MDKNNLQGVYDQGVYMAHALVGAEMAGLLKPEILDALQAALAKALQKVKAQGIVEEPYLGAHAHARLAGLAQALYDAGCNA